MSGKLFDRFWKICAADFLSPKDFVRHAVLIVMVFGIVHLLGWRECTSVLNGTTGAPGMDMETALLLGIAYALLYFATVVLVPILLIAAGLLALWRRSITKK